MQYYYLISFLLTLVLFTIIQYIEYNRIYKEENEEYSLFTLNNILLLIIIFIVISIALHYLSPIISTFNFDSYFNFSTNTTTITPQNGGNNNTIEEIDPKILSKINDNFDVGFEPFCSDIE